MKIFKLAAVLLILAGSFYACKKENFTDVQGKIIAYDKCPSYLTGNNKEATDRMVFGIYIVTDKDSLVVFNLSQYEFENLLERTVEDLDFGLNLPVNQPISVIFSYRKAKENEKIIAMCAGTTEDLSLHRLLLSERSTQIIISNINKIK